MLRDFLESELGYRPFLFNSAIGLYVFAKKKESFERMEKLILSFVATDKLSKAKIYDTSTHPYFFMLVTKDILTSKEVSSLGWKRLISSFLIQANPINASRTNSARVYERFRRCVLEHGSKHQKKFYNRRAKKLLRKVSMEGLEKFLRN